VEFELHNSLIKILGTPSNNNKNNKSYYYGDLFTMVGTTFLWVYFPSYNAYNASYNNNDKERAIVNSLLALRS